MTPDCRVGLGTDRHPLEEGERLVLGGETIPADRGTVGHSDADPAAHAVIDALLGGAGLGDIGSLFPPSEERWANADSLDLLERADARLSEAGWRVLNVDLTVRLETVDLADYRTAMREGLRGALRGAPPVSVKFKRGEGLGPVGRGEAVEALSVALLGDLEEGS